MAGSGADRARQQAHALATDAYAAYDAGRMGEAASKAEQAFRQQPTQGAWAMLWVAALEAQQQPEQADAAIATALQLGAPNVEGIARTARGWIDSVRCCRPRRRTGRCPRRMMPRPLRRHVPLSSWHRRWRRTGCC